MTGIEPARPAWKAGVLPLYDIRVMEGSCKRVRSFQPRKISSPFGSKRQKHPIRKGYPFAVHDSMKPYLELPKGIEPPTVCLQSRCTTVVLRQHVPHREPNPLVPCTSRLFPSRQQNLKGGTSWGRGGVEPPTCSHDHCCYSAVELYSPRAWYYRQARFCGFGIMVLKVLSLVGSGFYWGIAFLRHLPNPTSIIAEK